MNSKPELNMMKLYVIVMIIACLCNIVIQGEHVSANISSTTTKGRRYRLIKQTALLETPVSTIANVSEMIFTITCEHHTWCLSANFHYKRENLQKICNLFNVSMLTNGVQSVKDKECTYIEFRYPRDCGEVEGIFVQGNGSYEIAPFTTNVIKVACSIDSAGAAWTVLLRRFDGSLDFNRPWQDYRRGFGSLSKEFWIGLENIHQLTANGKYRLRFEMTDGDRNFTYAEYDNLKVADEDANYRLDFDSFVEGTAYDSFNVNNGMEFSSPDRDNDINTCIHCAANKNGGGWFKACGIVNIFGEYNPGDQDTHRIFSWPRVQKGKHGLSSLEMKIMRIFI